MKSVDDYLRQWDLHDPVLIEETKMCCVYHVRTSTGENRALKVMNEIGVRFESETPLWLNFMNGRGAVSLYAHDRNAVLMEYAGGGELSDLVESGKDEEAVHIALSTIKALHDDQDRNAFPTFKSLEEHYVCLFETSLDHPIIAPAQDSARTLIETQKKEDIRVLHADIHHKNILKSDRGWLAIDPQNVIGDRHYEPANLFKNPEGFNGVFEATRFEMIKNKAEAILSLNQERLHQFAFTHMALSAAWHVLDHENPSRALQVGEMLYSYVQH